MTAIGIRPTFTSRLGVGGLTAAMAEGMALAQPATRMVVVEPVAADCVGAALRAGRPTKITGSLASIATMLACGLADLSALEILKARNAIAMTVDEARLQASMALLSEAGGPETTASGATGLNGFLHVARSDLLMAHLLTSDSSVLLVMTEGALR